MFICIPLSLIWENSYVIFTAVSVMDLMRLRFNYYCDVKYTKYVIFTTPIITATPIGATKSCRHTLECHHASDTTPSINSILLVNNVVVGTLMQPFPSLALGGTGHRVSCEH